MLSQTVENEVKDENREFLSMLAAALGASLIVNMLTGKGVIRGSE